MPKVRLVSTFNGMAAGTVLEVTDEEANDLRGRTVAVLLPQEAVVTHASIPGPPNRADIPEPKRRGRPSRSE